MTEEVVNMTNMMLASQGLNVTITSLVFSDPTLAPTPAPTLDPTPDVPDCQGKSKSHVLIRLAETESEDAILDCIRGIIGDLIKPEEAEQFIAEERYG
jgi:hypothetical protein